MFIFPTIAVLLFIMFPTPVFADRTDQCGDNMTFSQNGTILTIEGTGNMYNYDQGSYPHWDNNITEVVIGSGVTSIGDYAFTLCSQLKDIEIPASVISIGNAAFVECSSLTTVSFNFRSKLETIGDAAFAGCFQLKDIEIPATVTSIGNAAFAACSNVNVSTNNHYFKKTGSTIYSADATQLLWVSTQVKSISINDGTTSIGDYTFVRCSQLEKIEIPASVTSIGKGTFGECSSLTTVSFIGDSQLRTIGDYAFAGCSQLKNIEIPASITSIGNAAFAECSSLTTVYFNDGSKLETIGTEVFPCSLRSTLNDEINGVSITYYHLYVNTQTGNITDVCSAEPCNIFLTQAGSRLYCTIESNDVTYSYYVTPNKITEEIYEFALQHNNLSTNMLCRFDENSDWQIMSPQNDLLIACPTSEYIQQVSQPSRFTDSSLKKYLNPLQSKDPSDTLQFLVKAIFDLCDAAVSLTNPSSANSPLPKPSSIDGIIDKDKKCKLGSIWQTATVLWKSNTILRVTYNNTDTSATKVVVHIASYTYTLELSSGSSYIDIPVPFKWYAEKIRITPLDEDNTVLEDVLTYSINTYLAKEIECNKNTTHKNFAIAAYYCGKYAAEYENS